MPGNGEIGGGSCWMDFNVTDKEGKHRDRWNCEDADTGCPFTLTINVVTKKGEGSLKPDEYTVRVEKGDVVRLSWKNDEQPK